MTPGQFLLCVSPLAMVFASPAYAADAPAPEQPLAADAGAAAPADDQLADIVVTATKRSQNLQDVPLSISAFTGETLQQSGVTSQTALPFVTPGLTFSYGSSGYARPYIRGVGNDLATPGSEPSVATYVDGVYQSQQLGSVQNFSTLIDRIEVLKGPQGTLYGRNATGGAINIITKSPGDKVAGDFTGIYGNYDYVKLDGVVSGPLTEGLGLLVGGFYERRDGFSTNLFNGGDLDTLNRHQIFGKLVIAPTDKFELVVSGTYFRENDSSGGQFSSYSPNALGTAFGGRTTFRSRDVYNNFIPSTKTRMASGSVRAKYEVTDTVSLLSITSYSDAKFRPKIDLDATDAPGVTEFIADNQFGKTLTQEFQANYSGDALTLVGGLFYLHDHSGYRNPGLTAPLNPAFVGGVANVALVRTGEVKSDAYAAYADATLDITSRFSIGGGIRYSHEKKSIFNLSDTFRNLAPTVNFPNAGKTYNNVDFKALAKYDLGDTNLYAKYETGFKSGIFKLTSPTFPGPIPPEKIRSYVVGVKSALFDRRVRLNLAGYYYSFRNLQLQSVDQATGAAKVLSAPKASIRGIEADLQAAVTSNFSINVGANVMDAHFDRYRPDTIFVPATSIAGNPFPFGNVSVNPSAYYTNGDLKGNKLARAPDFTLTAGANLTIPLPRGSIGSAINYYHSGKYYEEVENRLTTGPYDILNASLRYNFERKGTYVEAWGRNIFGEKYATNVQVSSAGDAVQYGPPATYGVTVGIGF